MTSAACPKCGRPVYRRGSQRGVRRYSCGPCRWHGALPIGVEADRAKGIDRAASKALAAAIRRARGVRRYVVTAAQNATPVNKPFLAALMRYAAERKARLVVIPYRYKNPTSHWSAKAEGDDWWAAELAPYLLDRRVLLNDGLVLLADIKTQPTAASPLSGFETMTGRRSGVIGHPKIQMATVATPQQSLPKILTTTGAVTQKNYIQSKAGKQGAHHHSFGAAVVEISGARFHLRQINAVRDGSFIDLDREYTPTESRPAPRAAGLVMGDSHVEFIDPGVVEATFEGPDSMVGVLNPREIVWHDVHDFYSRNHHHRGEVFINYVKHHTGRDNVEKQLDRTFAFIDRVTPKDARNIFVASNHPEALARWIKETDPRTDPENCVFWARTFEAMACGAKWTKTGARTIDPFAFWAARRLKCAGRSLFLDRDQAHAVAGIAVDQHGDAGPNGAKGTIRGFAKIGAKTVTGHGHSPGIEGGAYRVGTSSRLRLEYVKGASSWLQTHCVIYANGKRSLLSIIQGEWRA